MTDLTVIFLTANRVPPGWAEYHRVILERAVGDYEVITVSRRPVHGLGLNLIDDDVQDYANIYRQLLRAARVAETPFVAVAEDDTLYSREHFGYFRPGPDEVAYNLARWSLFTWRPVYNLRLRVSNCTLIAPREYLVDALTERFERWPKRDYPMQYMGEVGRNSLEDGLRISRRRAVQFYSPVPVVQLSHPSGTEDRQQTQRKKLASLQALDIPHWGRAEEIVRHYA